MTVDCSHTHNRALNENSSKFVEYHKSSGSVALTPTCQSSPLFTVHTRAYNSLQYIYTTEYLENLKAHSGYPTPGRGHGR